jgi:exodeoxyribonuclease V alpha subunit
VEAGAVFGDVCHAAEEPGFSAALSARAVQVFGEPLPQRARPGSPIADSVVTLTRSYRFDDASGIGGLARAIFAGDDRRALELCKTSSDVALSELGPNELTARLAQLFVERYRKLVTAETPAQAFAELDRFRLLTAHRKGPFGVERLNLACEQALHENGLINRDLGRFYPGRPVLVTENDYHLGLFNGDVGIVLSIDGASRVYFPRPEGGERTLVPSRLPEHQTVFAMSIHKSQGSEFDEVAVVLPEPRSPLLTRELCYTAITRARNRVELYGPADSLAVGIARRTSRMSGLADALVQETSNSLKA